MAAQTPSTPKAQAAGTAKPLEPGDVLFFRNTGGSPSLVQRGIIAGQAASKKAARNDHLDERVTHVAVVTGYDAEGYALITEAMEGEGVRTLRLANKPSVQGALVQAYAFGDESLQVEVLRFPKQAEKIVNEANALAEKLTGYSTAGAVRSLLPASTQAPLSEGGVAFCSQLACEVLKKAGVQSVSRVSNKITPMSLYGVLNDDATTQKQAAGSLGNSAIQTVHQHRFNICRDLYPTSTADSATQAKAKSKLDILCANILWKSESKEWDIQGKGSSIPVKNSESKSILGVPKNAAKIYNFIQGARAHEHPLSEERILETVAQMLEKEAGAGKSKPLSRSNDTHNFYQNSLSKLRSPSREHSFLSDLGSLASGVKSPNSATAPAIPQAPAPQVSQNGAASGSSTVGFTRDGQNSAPGAPAPGA